MPIRSMPARLRTRCALQTTHLLHPDRKSTTHFTHHTQVLGEINVEFKLGHGVRPKDKIDQGLESECLVKVFATTDIKEGAELLTTPTAHPSGQTRVKYSKKYRAQGRLRFNLHGSAIGVVPQSTCMYKLV